MKMIKPRDFYIYYSKDSNWWCWLNYKVITGFSDIEENIETRQDEYCSNLIFKLYFL